MGTSVSGLSGSYLQQVLAGALQTATGNAATGNAGSTNSAVSGTQSDSTQLSPFAQLVSTLQQLQKSNPAEYAKVAAQISTNLQAAAQTAQSQGNTSASSQLTQLASDFTNAAKTDQLPDLQDLGQAAGGGGHHHRGDRSGSTSSSAISGNDSQSAQSSSLNAATIILQTLSSAGINTPSN